MVRYNPLHQLQTLSDLTRHMFKDDSHFTIITGKNKAGKTTMAFNLMEKAQTLDLGFTGYGSNVHGVKSPFEMDFIQDMETLTEIVGANDKYLFLFDEMGKSLGKRRFMARLNVDFLDKLQVIRKYRLSMIGCAIGDSVDREILQPYYLNSWIDKGSRYTKPKATYYDIDLEASREFSNLQRCQTSFKQYSVATFSLEARLQYTDFQDDKKQRIYRWAQGETIKELGLDATQFRRDLRAFVLESSREKQRGQKDILLREDDPESDSPAKPL